MNETKKIEEFFGVKNSSNSIIDSELNRIWGYLKLQNIEINNNVDNKITENLNSIKNEFNDFKNSYETNLTELKSSIPNISSLINIIKNDIFKSEEFMVYLFKIIEENLKIPTKIKITLEGKTVDKVRMEFGYAKTGAVVFYKKAFEKILWSIPNDITLVTNTGFVALKDTFWLIIGEDN